MRCQGDVKARSKGVITRMPPPGSEQEHSEQNSAENRLSFLPKGHGSDFSFCVVGRYLSQECRGGTYAR